MDTMPKRITAMGGAGTILNFDNSFLSFAVFVVHNCKTHSLRHPYSKRGAAGGQDRTESTAGGCMKRQHTHGKVLSQGNYASVIENGQKSGRTDRNEK